MLIEYCQLQPGMRVLEIGCGTGSLSERLVPTGVRLTATDILPEFLGVTTQKCVGYPIETKIVDAETLAGLTDGSFEAVVGLSILHHLNLKDVLASIHRVLTAGGICAFSEPNMLNPQIALQKNIPFLKRMLGDTPDETAFFTWQMKKALKTAGFQDIRVFPFDFLHPSIPDSLAASVEAVGNLLEKVPLLRQIAGSIFLAASKQSHAECAGPCP